VGRRNGRTTGPLLRGQNKKTPPPDLPWANKVSDVFVVGGATAVGYLWGLLSEICANQSAVKSFLWRGSLLPLGCEAAPKLTAAMIQVIMVAGFTTASPPSGSKLPRHKGIVSAQ